MLPCVLLTVTSFPLSYPMPFCLASQLSVHIFAFKHFCTASGQPAPNFHKKNTFLNSWMENIPVWLSVHFHKFGTIEIFKFNNAFFFLISALPIFSVIIRTFLPFFLLPPSLLPPFQLTEEVSCSDVCTSGLCQEGATKNVWNIWLLWGMLKLFYATSYSYWIMWPSFGCL